MKDKKKVCMAFVILHYNSIDDTRKCIESIRRLAEVYTKTDLNSGTVQLIGRDSTKEKQEPVHIVVVDNASPNGSGSLLKNEYGGVSDITLIMNRKNSGFSAGNNIGYKYVKENLEPDFVTVCNNDIVFDDEDFISKVVTEYKERHFFVMGPDIFNPILGIHQSPLGETSPSPAAARRTIKLNTIAEYTFPLFWPVFGKREVEKAKKRGDSVPDYDVSKEDVPLMGACLVLSKDFLEVRDNAFEPVTFMYYEEFMLYNFCIRNGYAMVYEPSIHVTHNEGSATKTAAKDEKDKYRRLVKNIRRAAQVYLDDMLK